MDHRQTASRGIPSKASDRDLAAQWRDWIDAAMAHYERQGGTRGLVVRKDRAPGTPPGALDLRLETEGAHDLRERLGE